MTDLPAVQQNNDDQNQSTLNNQTPVTAGVGKERAGTQEVTPMTEYTRQVDLEPEVEGWLEKVEKEDSQLQQSVVDPSLQGSSGQVVLDNVQSSNFKVILPMSKDEVDKGLQHKVLDSVRWLAEWCMRMIKMFGNKVAYRRK
ncbi:MAG: hypothetical protein U0946_00010 [Patescibacteria group bacterium]|nr:hypothetical protein [Patescibacteria group bacterium]